MKIQDFIFLGILLVLIIIRKPRLSVSLGIVSLLIAIPLFSKWIFFTAERLTWYAAAFFLLATLQLLFSIKYEDRN